MSQSPIAFKDETVRGREVRWIQLTREAQANALSIELLSEATERISEARDKAIFISSRGGTFSGGLDLVELWELGSAQKPLEHLIRLYEALVNHPCPTACLVEQKAVAGGVGLALCADAVVMTCNAWISLPEPAVYRPLADILFPFVHGPRGITMAAFQRWFGKTVTAAELLQEDHIDCIVHRDGSYSVRKLKKAAVDVLEAKDLYPRSDLGDRLDSPSRERIEEQTQHAIESSETPVFQQALEMHVSTNFVAKDVFFSYSTADSSLARELVTALKMKGVSCFLAEESILAGSVWSRAIVHAVESSRLGVILLTPNSIDSKWVMAECGALWAMKKPVMPALLFVDDKDLPEFIGNFQSRRIETIGARNEFIEEVVAYCKSC